MSDKVFLATLYHGLTYCHGHEVFEAGYPKIVSAELASKLRKVVDLLPLAVGDKKVARRKFVIQEYPLNEAEAIVREYGNHKGEKTEEELLEIVEATADAFGEADDEIMTVDAEFETQQSAQPVKEIENKADVDKAPVKRSTKAKN